MKYDIMPFDIMTYEVMKFDVMKYNVMTYDAMTYDVVTYDIKAYNFFTACMLSLLCCIFLSITKKFTPFLDKKQGFAESGVQSNSVLFGRSFP